MTTLYIVRHGQSEANKAGILQGSKIDTPLTAKGRQQAQAVHQNLVHFNFNQVYASPLLRAAQTAQIIAAKTTTTFDSRLKEYDYGDWDGQLEKDIHQKYQQFFNSQHNLLPGSDKVSHGESFAAVTARLEDLFKELANKHGDEKILIVSHGFTIKLMLNAVLGIQNLVNLNEPSNAGVTKIELTPETTTLLAFNQEFS
ncbi:histidine phosphatase family protein [Liquorilactobacillus capillatus]|uniref:Phosphoglycerate mutase n=1 Tax=Liquorilactobacillus capillatus DSM 19910 TaxID=1423731 RepID=A0A0R1MC19_9LACO|nr:histidine phosphatase family protein [Liquorilactobacillus capillatus]KRL00904.1 phosphoglycerate mutase [Liquorilactobacillus capillatus DSM 19910]